MRRCSFWLAARELAEFPELWVMLTICLPCRFQKSKRRVIRPSVRHTDGCAALGAGLMQVVEQFDSFWPEVGFT